MRNLLFKNITSGDKRQRILSSSEFTEQEGVHSSIHRHLLCRIFDVDKSEPILPLPTLHIVKKRDTKIRIETFYCRIKGKMYLAAEDKLYLVAFIHSLRIELKAIPAIAK